MAPGAQQGVGYQMPLFYWLWAGHVGAGLLNLGNTCYANAALQCLTYTPPLANYLLARADRPFCRNRPLCALCALQTHVQRTLLCPGATVSPVKELLSGFHAHRQEDAHEFLMFTLDALQRPCPQGPECMPGQPGDFDLVQRLFGGLWSSQLCCLRCMCVSTRLEPYLDVVLDIHTTDSMERALEALAETETLDGDNAYHCEACGDKGPASKTLALQEPSQVLVLVLNRFCGLTGSKLAKPVRYPPQLDLGMLVRQPDAGPLPYVLHTVLVHAGSGCHQGYYFCFIRAGPDCWFCMDDADVTACDASTALSQQAYMLFYVRQSESELYGASGIVTTAERTPQPSSTVAGLAPEIPLWEHPVNCHPMVPEPERAAPTLTLNQWREWQEILPQAQEDLLMLQQTGHIAGQARPMGTHQLLLPQKVTTPWAGNRVQWTPGPVDEDPRVKCKDCGAFGHKARSPRCPIRSWEGALVPQALGCPQGKENRNPWYGRLSRHPERRGKSVREVAQALRQEMHQEDLLQTLPLKPQARLQVRKEHVSNCDLPWLPDRPLALHMAPTPRLQLNLKRGGPAAWSAGRPHSCGQVCPIPASEQGCSPPASWKQIWSSAAHPFPAAVGRLPPPELRVQGRPGRPQGFPGGDAQASPGDQGPALIPQLRAEAGLLPAFAVGSAQLARARDRQDSRGNKEESTRKRAVQSPPPPLQKPQKQACLSSTLAPQEGTQGVELELALPLPPLPQGSCGQAAESPHLEPRGSPAEKHSSAPPRPSRSHSLQPAGALTMVFRRHQHQQWSCGFKAASSTAPRVQGAPFLQSPKGTLTPAPRSVLYEDLLVSSSEEEKEEEEDTDWESHTSNPSPTLGDS